MKSSPACTMLVLAVAALMALNYAAASSPPRPVLVQSIDIQVPVAPVSVQIAGRPHLVYELHVTNFRPYDVILNRLEIIDAVRGSRIAELHDSQLAAHLGRVGTRAEGRERQIVPAGG